ncbi:hypothetical protein V2G26_009272 [Clonostachys chloroleuca]
MDADLDLITPAAHARAKPLSRAHALDQLSEGVSAPQSNNRAGDARNALWEWFSGRAVRSAASSQGQGMQLINLEI